MNRWYSRIQDIEFKDGHKEKEHHLVFETTDESTAKRVEMFFKVLMDERDGDNHG